MQFIHLTSTRNLKSIRKTGLLPRRGQCGVGVYCVPSLNLPRFSFMEDQIVHSERTSLLGNWKWLLRQRSASGRRPASAVLFSLRAQDFPIYLVCPFDREPLKRLSKHLESMRRNSIDVVNLDCMITTGLWLKTSSKAAEQKAKDTFQNYEFGWITVPNLDTLDQALSFNSMPDAETEDGTLFFQIKGAKELGLIWNILNDIEYSDGGNLEIVVPRMVPANRIKQILPLHQTKDQFKTKKNKET